MNPLTTQNTPDAVPAEVADPLDPLLRQIVNGYFVLTDGQGSVSKWSEPAELLSMQPSEDILGKGFFETLIGGTIPPAGQAWREFLDLGEPPRVPGTVQLVGRRGDGSEPPISVSKKPLPRMSSAGCRNSSSAGSDHLETDPWPSVRTK